MGGLLSKFTSLFSFMQAIQSFEGGDADEVKTPFDQFIDALNRLIRPIILFGFIAMFVWAVIDPIGFTLFGKALNSLPEHMWILILSVVLSWFVAKSAKDIRRPKPPLFPRDLDPIVKTPDVDVPQGEKNNSIDAWKKNATKRDSEA